MTNKEAIEQLKKIRTIHNGNYAPAIDLAIKALEQQPSEDMEVIQVSKGALKSRQGRFVIYDVEWLKEHFYTTEEKIYGQPKQPKRGKWINNPDENAPWFVCSECGAEFYECGNYCTECGSDNREEADE